MNDTGNFRLRILLTVESEQGQATGIKTGDRLRWT